jgi:hypothetical protein
MPYIAMELACGGSLFSLMNANPGHTDIARVIKICQQVALALQCASDQGCVHGDVKPENILLDANGSAKLVDFGLAAMQKDTSEIWGTPYYISPEKVKKETIDFKADMYSLGCTLYHALTGVAPFEGDDAIAVVKKRFEGMPKKPSEIRSDISPAIDDLVMQMIALEKDNRFPSFEALLESFKNVLTTGLTTTTSSNPAPATTAAKRPATTLTKRTATLRARRTGLRSGVTSVRKKLPKGEEGNEGAIEEDANPANNEEDDENEGGGNLGLKVVGVVVGVIVLIALVAGGLVWYQISSKNAQKAQIAAQIADQTQKARTAISDTANKALQFADEFDAFAKRAVEECDKPTQELIKILPAEIRPLLKPAPTKELLDAIASTNVVVNAPEAQQSTNVVAAATATNAPSATQAATNAPPAKADQKAKPEAKAEVKPAPEKKPEEKGEPPHPAVVAMNELWERAYTCQACAIRIRASVNKLIADAASAEALAEPTRENMEKLGTLSRTLVEQFELIKASKDVDTVRKGISFIKSKGEKTVEQTIKRIRIEKLEADRKAKAEAMAAAEKARQEKLAEERKQLVEEETTAAQAKFDAVSAQGCFRQLDWKTATRLLKSQKDECKTAEGQLAVDLQIRKVEAMSSLFEIFIKHLAGYKGSEAYTFRRGKLKGAKVVLVNDREIQLARGKKKFKVTWQKFNRESYVNLLELMNHFAYNGRKNAGLSQRDVAEALTGGALFLQLVCIEETTAIERAETLAKAAVKEFPDYLKTAQSIFPDISFEEAAE